MNNGKGRLLNSFYYLAPLWFVVEMFFWPRFRAGVVVGPSAWGAAGFYAVESGIGAALWLKLPYANLGALTENVIYLVFALKFILFSPTDIALSLINDNPNAAGMAQHYVSSLPGILYSAAHVVLKIEQGLNRTSIKI